MDSFKFHLIYATRNIKGVKVFKAAEKRTEKKTHSIRAELQQRQRESKSGNFELFSPEVRYHENCYQRLTQTNKKKAKDAVRSLIEASATVSYDDCWGEALQFSAVYEQDLRGWIDNWQQEGLISIEGQAPRARVLHAGKGLTVVSKKND